MAEAAGGGGGGGGGGEKTPKSQAELYTGLLDTAIGRTIGSTGGLNPIHLFKLLYSASTFPGNKVQPLIQADVEESTITNQSDPDHPLHLSEKTKISSMIKQPIIYESAHLFEYLFKGNTIDNSEGNTNDNSVKKTNNKMVEEVFDPNSAFGKSNNKNSISLPIGDSIYKYLTAKKGKEGIFINKTIKDAVKSVFSGETMSNKIEDYPIYFIAAYPDGGRHLSIVVFYRGFLYSCGVIGQNNRISGTVDPEAEDLRATTGGAASSAASSYGAGSVPATTLGLWGVMGLSGVFDIVDVLGIRRSTTAAIVSPDIMFKKDDTRIFDIGILRPTHILALEKYLSYMKNPIDMFFKSDEKVRFQGSQEVLFNAFQFPLSINFSTLSNPVISEFALNCTSFVLSIFTNTIDCGKVVVDPKECKSLKADTFELRTDDEELMNLVHTMIAGYLKHTNPTYRRNAYISLMLYKFINAYILNKNQEKTINELMRINNTSGSEVYKEEKTVARLMSGGKRHISKRKTKARRKRRSTKRRSNI